MIPHDLHWPQTRQQLPADILDALTPLVEFVWENRAVLADMERWIAPTKYVRIYRGQRRPYGRARRARR